MKLSLINIVLMLMITSYKAMVDGHKMKIRPPWRTTAREKSTTPSPTCTYPMSHNRTQLHYLQYGRDIVQHATATAEFCQELCTLDTGCNSVAFLGGGSISGCFTYSVKVGDITREEEKYTVKDEVTFPTAITYDKCCGLHDCAELPGLKCNSTTYSVSHKMMMPAHFYLLHTFGNSTTTAETCQKYCNDDVKCRSVAYASYCNVEDGEDKDECEEERVCYKFDTSVQELKDLHFHELIVTGNNTKLFERFQTKVFKILITYDRDCVKPWHRGKE